jgi:amino-acid N-acetyltransferase
MTPAIRSLPPGQDVQSLLAEHQLPTADLQEGCPVELFGCVADGRLCGMVGLEVYGRDALLRSLVVPHAQRSRGLGAALVAHAEQWAARRGVRTLYLLTTTAAGFFERQGYRHIPRHEAPAAIAGTSQFSGLCPASSAFMAKPLDDGAAHGRDSGAVAAV